MDLYVSLVKKELAQSKDGLTLDQVIKRVQEYIDYSPPHVNNTFSHLLQELLAREEFQLENVSQLPKYHSAVQTSDTMEYNRNLAKNINASQEEKQVMPLPTIGCSETVFLRVCGFSELDQAQISSESFRILTIIAKYTYQGGISQSRLAKLASVDSHTLHHHIKVLRNMRLISRKREIRNSGDSNKPMKTYKVFLSSFRFKSDGAFGDNTADTRQESLKSTQNSILESCESTELNNSDAEVFFDNNTYLKRILMILFKKEGYTMSLNNLKEAFIKEQEECFVGSEEHSIRKKRLRYWRNAMNKLEERKLVERFMKCTKDEENSEEIEYVRLRMFEEEDNDSLQKCREITGVQNRLLWERTLEFQVLSLIIESGERGISQREILTKLGCKASRKVISSFCKGLMTNFGFRAKSVQEGKQAVYYYVAPEYFRQFDLNNTNFVKMKEFLESSNLCSKTQQVMNLQNEMRTKNLLDHIREEKVLNLSDLGHLLAVWEAASFSRVDKKTVGRLIQRLEEAGFIKILSLNMPYMLERDSPQQIRLVTLPEVDENSAEIQNYLRNWNCSTGWKTMKTTTKGIKAKNASKEPVYHFSSHQNGTTADKQESSRPFLGKMLHGRRLHLHLIQYILRSQQKFDGVSNFILLDVVIKSMITEDFLELFGDSSCLHWVPSDALHFPINSLPENIVNKLCRSRPVNRKLNLLVDLLERLFLLSRQANFQCKLVKEIVVCGWNDSSVKFTFHEIADVDKFWFYLQRNCLLFASKGVGLFKYHQSFNNESETTKLCLHNLFPGAFSRKQWCDKIWKLSRHSRQELSESLKNLLAETQGNVTHDSLSQLSEYFHLDVCEIFTEAIREANSSKERMSSILKESRHDDFVPQSMNGESLQRQDKKVVTSSRRKRRLSLDPPTSKLSNQSTSDNEKAVSQVSKVASVQKGTRQKRRSIRTTWTNNQDKELIIHVFDQKVSEIERSLGGLKSFDSQSVLQAKVKSWDAIGSQVGYNGQACKRRFFSLCRTFPYNEIISQICQHIVDLWRNNNLSNFQSKSVLESLLPLENFLNVGSRGAAFDLSSSDQKVRIPDSVQELTMQYDIEYLHGKSCGEIKPEHHWHDKTNTSSSEEPKRIAIEELIKLVLRESEDTYVLERGMSILNRFTEEELNSALESLRQRGVVVSQKADRHNREYSVSCKILKVTSDNPFDDSFHDDFTHETKGLVENAFLGKEIIVDKDNQRSGSVAAILSLALTGDFLLSPNVDKTYFETIKAKGLSKSVGSGGIGFHLKQYSDKKGLSHISSREDIPPWSIDFIPLDITQRFVSQDNNKMEEEPQLPSFHSNCNDDYEVDFSLSIIANYSKVEVDEIQTLLKEIESFEENGMTMEEIEDRHPNWTIRQREQILQGLVHFRNVYISFIHGDKVRFLSQRFAQRFLVPKVDAETGAFKEQMIPFPWTNLAGKTDTKSLMALQYWILFVVMTHPGIEENHLWSLLRESEIPLASVRTIVEMLERDCRISKLRRFVENVGYITYYVPEQNCMGSFSQ